MFFLLNLLLGLGLQALSASGQGWSVYAVGYPYVLPLLLVTMQAAGGRQLFIAAGLGLLIDLLYGTLGIHMAATVAMAYTRQLVVAAFTPSSLRESLIYPRPLYMGWGWYIIYLSILLFVHQLCIFSLEAGTLLHGLYTLSALFRSFFVTWLFCCVIELLRLLFPTKKR